MKKKTLFVVRYNKVTLVDVYCLASANRSHQKLTLLDQVKMTVKCSLHHCTQWSRQLNPQSYQSADAATHTLEWIL